MQFLSLMSILILLLYFIVSKDLVYTGICEIKYQELNDFFLCYIYTVLLLKLWIVSAIQFILSVSFGSWLVS